MKRSTAVLVALIGMTSAASAQTAGNWSGFYLGIHGGLGLGSNSSTAITPTGTFASGDKLGSSDLDGALGGVQVGYNYQSGTMVLGLEADLSASSLTGRDETRGTLNTTRITTSEATIGWMSTVAGRVGFASGNWLLYGKAGWAWADFGASAWTRTGTNAAPGSGAVITVTEGGETRDGYLLGLGAEYRVTRNWSVRAEYNFVDFGTDKVNRLVIGGGTTGDVLVRENEADLHAVKLGINYKF